MDLPGHGRKMLRRPKNKENFLSGTNISSFGEPTTIITLYRRCLRNVGYVPR